MMLGDGWDMYMEPWSDLEEIIIFPPHICDHHIPTSISGKVGRNSSR